jgi:ABC-type glucose/galactose transport system permease subunit
MKKIYKTGLFLAICLIALLLITPPVAAAGSSVKVAGWNSLSFYKTAPLASWNPVVKTVFNGGNTGTSQRVPRIGTTASPDHFDALLAQLTYSYPSGCGV